MTDHFSLDVHPADLRLVAKKLGQLNDHLATKGAKATATPGEIGEEWTGEAATAIKAEMTGLGGTMTASAPKFGTSEQALVSLAGDYEDAQEQVVSLNTKWAAAEATYADAVAAAGAAYDKTVDGLKDLPGGIRNAERSDAQTSRSNATSEASSARSKTQHDLEYAFGMMKLWLSQQTKAAATALAEAAPSKVSDEQINDWKRGAYPTRLDHPGLLSAMAQAAAREKLDIEALQKAEQEAAERAAQEDVDALEALLEQQPIEDPEALKDLLEKIGGKADDPLYSKALVDLLGVDGVNDVYDSIDNYYAMYGYHDYEVEDWMGPLKAFNDVLASGLAQYNDADLAKFVGQLAGPTGGSARFAQILGSDYADNRIMGLGLTYLTRMEESKYFPGDLRRDIAQDLTAYGDLEEMAKRFADATDSREYTELLENVDKDTAAWIVEGLLDDGGDDPVSQEIWEQKQRVYLATLDTAVRDDRPGAVEALLGGLERVGYLRVDDLLGEVQKRFEDPALIQMLAAHKTEIDQELVAKAAKLVFEDVDVTKVAQALIEADLAQGDGAKKTADDLGYLLGLADIADTKVDMGGTLNAILGAAVGATGKAAAVAGPALSILTALFEANAEAEKKLKDYGEGWSKEKQHEVLAFVTYVATEGPPPGYEEWLAANASELPSDEPDAAVVRYLAEIRGADRGTPEYDAWSDIEELFEQIGETRRIGS